MTHTSFLIQCVVKQGDPKKAVLLLVSFHINQPSKGYKKQTNKQSRVGHRDFTNQAVILRISPASRPCSVRFSSWLSAALMGPGGPFIRIRFLGCSMAMERPSLYTPQLGCVPLLASALGKQGGHKAGPRVHHNSLPE